MTTEAEELLCVAHDYLVDKWDMTSEPLRRIDAKVKEILSADRNREEVPGWKLAMRVMQSDLYPLLDDAEREECDALVNSNPYMQQRPVTPPIAEGLLDIIDNIDSMLHYNGFKEDCSIRHNLAVLRSRISSAAPQPTSAPSEKK